jgi:hypothetical protein
MLLVMDLPEFNIAGFCHLSGGEPSIAPRAGDVE